MLFSFHNSHLPLPELTDLIRLHGDLLCPVDALTRPGEDLGARHHLLSVLVRNSRHLRQPPATVVTHPSSSSSNSLRPRPVELGLETVPLPPVFPHVGQHLRPELERSRPGLGLHLVQGLPSVLQLASTNLPGHHSLLYNTADKRDQISYLNHSLLCLPAGRLRLPEVGRNLLHERVQLILSQLILFTGHSGWGEKRGREVRFRSVLCLLKVFSVQCS